jgi:hypothetical protein
MKPIEPNYINLFKKMTNYVKTLKSKFQSKRLSFKT